MSIVSKIKANPTLKRLALRLLIPANQHQPRLWVKLILNPFSHKKGRNSVVRARSRMDVFPFNGFILGAKSIIEDFATINNGVGAVMIGQNTIIGIGCVIIGPVSVGNDVMLAQNIVVSGLNHGYEDVNIATSKQAVTCKEIIIEDEVWIGANSVITAGVRLGRHCVIGAGSIVTKDVPEFSVAVGNPAKVIKKYDFKENRWRSV
ncbi:acetyltransferase [Pedobacter quisquiliarum]|jgi:acetyltransferase-like isoleucine patch superfamily enzyme|uniref:Acetyltransferase n=1 Tax=Pedobacter quisquiliarum TaxID=1834438 RepID=A0A916UHR2_9SPHI|nr:acyltransferase [Pedobacter quisquiliarum]GGC71389.1 acetyltransferase [Pedobacter quisquiliarum]